MNKSDTGINLTNFTESVAILIPLKKSDLRVCKYRANPDYYSDVLIVKGFGFCAR